MIDRSQPIEAEHAESDPPPAIVEAAVTFDNHLRGRMPPPSTDVAGETPGERRSFFDCLQLLERAWPRTADDAAPAGPQRIGKFEIERVLGQGGFGIVYLAHDVVLGRTVALKVPRLHTLASRSLLARFQREGRAAASLDHPHIVPLYEAGEGDGLCYIASAYCPGPNLAEWLRSQKHEVDSATAARLVLQLADAAAYSHGRGVLHRDIKPGNVMLVPASQGAEARGGTGLPFSPRLGDFGLAKLVLEAAAEPGGRDDSAGVALLGTPSYMAPEQLEGAREVIGPATDIYALGVVLYELLAGRPPFQGSNVVDVLDQVRNGEPVPLRRLRRDVPRDLETICLKCLAKAPSQRYESAESLRNDLQRFLDGLPIRARPPGTIDMTVKWVRRRPAAAALVVTAAFALLGFVGLQTWHAARLESKNSELQLALGQVTEEKARAVASEQEARGIAYALDIQSAWRSRKDGDFHSFSQIIDRYRDGTPLAQHRGNEWHYLERFTRTQEQTLLQQEAPTYDIVFGPEGRAALVGEDAVVRLIDIASGAVTTSWPSGQVEVNSACFMPDGRVLWTAGDDGTIREWELATGRELRKIDAHQPAKVFKVKHLPQQNLLITCGTEGTIRLWDLGQGGAAAGVLEGHTDWVQDVVLTPDKTRVLSASDDYTVRCWELATRAELWSVKSNKDWRVLDVTLSPDGQLFAECSDLLRIFRTQDHHLELELPVRDMPRNACFDDTGERLFVSDGLGVVHAFDFVRDASGRITGATQFAQWRAHEGPVYSLRWSPAEQRVLTAGKDGRVSKWHAVGGPPPAVKRRFETHVQGFAFDPLGRWLVMGSKSGLSRYNHEDLQQPGLTLAPTGFWTAVAVNPQGTLIAAGDINGIVRTWDSDGRSLSTLREGVPVANPAQWVEGMAIASLSFSSDGAALAISGPWSYVEIVDPRTGVELQRIEVGEAEEAYFSPAGDLLATSTADHRIEVWDWRAARRVWQSEPMTRRPGSLAFLPDGQTLMVHAGDRTVLILDGVTGRAIRQLAQHSDYVSRIAVSPDGRTIATKGMSSLLHLWHAASGQCLYSLPAEEGGGHEGLAFSPDGRWLAYRGDLHELNLLPLHP